MTQEEKLEEAKRLYETANADQRYVLESLFPELRESEDERIRKAILELVKQSSEILGKKNQEQMIAWLEKQAQKFVWSEEDEKIISDAEVWLDTLCDYLKYSSSAYIPNVRVIISKLKSLKNRVQLQTKQEWSEEDEDMCYKTTAVINRLCAEGKEYVWSINTLKKLFYWLKSIKDRVQPQNRWKPSERQKEALLWCVVHLGGADKQALGELLKELNKL